MTRKPKSISRIDRHLDVAQGSSGLLLTSQKTVIAKTGTWKNKKNRPSEHPKNLDQDRQLDARQSSSAITGSLEEFTRVQENRHNGFTKKGPSCFHMKGHK